MAEIQPPSYQDGQCYTPEQDRALWDSLICAEGVCDLAAGDLRVADAATGLQVNVAAGCAWIQGDTVEDQGVYYVTNDAPVARVFDAADPVDDRIDLIIARVYDAQYAGTESRWAIEIVKGVASPAPVAPDLTALGIDNALILAEARIPAGATTITQSNITDRRTQFMMCSTAQQAQGITGVVKYETSGNFAKASYPNLRAVIVEVVGPGGTSRPVATPGPGQGSASSGGGGGGYSKRYILASALPANVTVAVGQGTTVDALPSSFGSFCSATAGAGGTALPPSQNGAAPGGAGGVGSGGDVNLTGGTGGPARVISGNPVPAGGGDAAGGMGVGGRSGGAVSGGAGVTPPPYGGGSSGGWARGDSSGTSQVSVPGASGVVIVTLIH